MTKKVKVGTWTVISPDKMNDRAMRQAVIDTLDDYAYAIQKEFFKTTDTWEHQPEFHVKTAVPGDGKKRASVEVYTEDKIYNLVNRGAPPHAISAVKAKALRFPSVFEPKTAPGVIDSTAGFEGGPIVNRQSVDHPGFDARNFDKVIAASVRKNFKSDMEKAMSRAAQASGHSLKPSTSGGGGLLSRISNFFKRR